MAAVRALAAHPNHKALVEELVDMMRTVLASVSSKGNLNLDVEWFNGRHPRLIWEVIFAALKENLGPLFEGGLSLSPPQGPPT